MDVDAWSSCLLVFGSEGAGAVVDVCLEAWVCASREEERARCCANAAAVAVAALGAQHRSWRDVGFGV